MTAPTITPEARRSLAFWLRKMADAVAHNNVAPALVLEIDQLVDAFRREQAEPFCIYCETKPAPIEHAGATYCSQACVEADVKDNPPCECCGASPSQGCACEITVRDGYDRETGPYSDRGCETHRVRV